MDKFSDFVCDNQNLLQKEIEIFVVDAILLSQTILVDLTTFAHCVYSIDCLQCPPLPFPDFISFHPIVHHAEVIKRKTGSLSSKKKKAKQTVPCNPTESE